jgi:hypothetical protein
MTSKTLQQHHEECLALLRPAGFERHEPDSLTNSYVWERVFADGSATSITYGENSPAGAAALPYWSTLHCFADARFSFSTRLTLPEALAQAARFERNGADNHGEPHP